MPTVDDLDPSKLGVLGNALGDAAEDYEPSALPAGLLTPEPGRIEAPRVHKPLPMLSIENTVCMRGPCRFLMTSTSAVEVESADYDAEATDRYCLVQSGTLMEIREPTYACSHWDPMSPKDSLASAREKRRATYLKSEEGILAQRAEAARLQRRADQRAKIDAEAAERNRERDIQKVKKAADVDAGNFEPQD